MARLEWDKTGERFYETGVDKGVLYVYKEGIYQPGVAWNGLTAVTESPSGAEANPQYADNIKYLNLVSNEEFGATIEAFMSPEEFDVCDGTASLKAGLNIGQQARLPFALCYRTKVGNDSDGIDKGYKIHIIYGAMAAPTERAYATINESPEALTFSWEVTTTPVAVSGHKPTSCVTIDSTKCNPTDLVKIEDALYGSAEGDGPKLLLPDEIAALCTTV